MPVVPAFPAFPAFFCVNSQLTRSATSSGFSTVANPSGMYEMSRNFREAMSAFFNSTGGLPTSYTFSASAVSSFTSPSSTSPSLVRMYVGWNPSTITLFGSKIDSAMYRASCRSAMFDRSGPSARPSLADLVAVVAADVGADE